MSKYRAGNTVKVTDDGYCYNTYSKWFEENAPEFLKDWKNGRHYAEGRDTTGGLIGTVLVAASHLTDGETGLCLVRANDESLFLIGERGLELLEGVAIS